MSLFNPSLDEALTRGPSIRPSRGRSVTGDGGEEARLVEEVSHDGAGQGQNKEEAA